MLQSLQYFNVRSSTLVLFNMHPLLPPELTSAPRAVCDIAYAKRFLPRVYFFTSFFF